MTVMAYGIWNGGNPLEFSLPFFSLQKAINDWRCGKRVLRQVTFQQANGAAERELRPSLATISQSQPTHRGPEHPLEMDTRRRGVLGHCEPARPGGGGHRPAARMMTPLQDVVAQLRAALDAPGTWEDVSARPMAVSYVQCTVEKLSGICFLTVPLLWNAGTIYLHVQWDTTLAPDAML
ncbi:hypothetical protein PR202_ga05493 [Eleusine coracana subsp. coracana]|uniref:Uncharacterized protein n=1 Tax=Eleusine coracana subsp. coracana TaxID=191504 RepID=A0AAV5BTJ1_ELECO|nr:hypothetical protein PR202_ga05040 [Eleusine coracana subsp. coracana]GJM89314.1 hypothetical protein PR202_ga05493 [Eleusine coracana subsp. coracana]